jgi:hypothetical protein
MPVKRYFGGCAHRRVTSHKSQQKLGLPRIFEPTGAMADDPFGGGATTR